MPESTPHIRLCGWWNGPLDTDGSATLAIVARTLEGDFCGVRSQAQAVDQAAGALSFGVWPISGTANPVVNRTRPIADHTPHSLAERALHSVYYHVGISRMRSSEAISCNRLGV